MEQHSSVLSLMIVVAIAFFIPLLLQRFKLKAIPVVVAEIIAGIFVGKSGFNVIEPDMWLEVLSTLGFIFLMFLSGLEIDFSIFKQKEKKNKTNEPNTFQVASTIFLFIFILSYGLSLMFVWLGFVDSALFMTLIISTISLGVVVPTLKENNLGKTAIGQIILLVAVIADLVTMILLAVFVGLNSESGQSMWLLLVLFGAGIVIYFVARRFQNIPYLESLKAGSVQIDTRAVFALILILVGLSESVGAENILGAFLAGVLVSLLSPNEEMVEKLDSIGYGFFIPIFFVMVGVNLEVWSIFKEPSSMLMIPILIVGLFISKLLPSLILRKWYPRNIVLGSAILLTSTLSLVIAAAQIGEKLKIISPSLSAALILSAVITCIFAPVLFKKMFPKVETPKPKVSIIGASRITLPLSLDLKREDYDVTLYMMRQNKLSIEESQSHDFPIVKLDLISIELLEEQKAFDADRVVVATSDDEQNLLLAEHAKELGVEHVIASVEDPLLQEKATQEHIAVFSTINSTRILLRALIDKPSLVHLITTSNETVREVELRSNKYNGLPLRRLPFLGDVLIIQVYRGKKALIPHGDTKLQHGDTLLVTGSKEHIDTLKSILE
ncbi:monovalent cation:proton antiporter family protein [Bacillus cytotoxicus]|uniref:Trk system potassium uptake protein TrkA n=1 Tax=Bacillus cytotoxicus TaxID=580165 RepID=A0AAX2CCU6_9BACI|nr:monovalent cation:proton antiporter family protein [Bacillus cytotoxicus]QTR83384.1 monovalent cation:proton antiporter family protein [Bacillus cytotoxicus]QTR87121.1 monovalent cation:proton antiporter family protein [Bacillus cytotoxicus]SCL85002.1 Trk system potassium uptake protein TrkA [Bacillus cytotoxicus]